MYAPTISRQTIPACWATKGASILFTLGAENISDNGGNAADASAAPYRNHATYPFMVVEYATPVISENLWLTAGFEGGLSIEKNCVADSPTTPTIRISMRSWIIPSANGASWWATDSAPSISVPKQIATEKNWKHSTHNHSYTVSVYHNFAPGHTLQGTFCRRIFNADFGDFVTAGDMEGAWRPYYTKDISERLAYVAELKHTYSKPNLVVSSSIKNIHQDLPGIDRDNTLGIGTTAFWHKGMLRVTAGVNYFWEKAEIFRGEEGKN